VAIVALAGGCGANARTGAQTTTTVAASTTAAATTVSTVAVPSSTVVESTTVPPASGTQATTTAAPAVTTTSAPVATTVPTAADTTAASTLVAGDATTAPPSTATTTLAGATTTGPPPVSTTVLVTTTVDAATLAECDTTDLTASFAVIPGSQGAGHEAARIVLTNSGTVACKTFGYIGLQLLSGTGQPLPTALTRSAPLNGGKAALVVVSPGASASTFVYFSGDIPGPGEPQSGPCEPTAVMSEITPPNDFKHLVVPGPATPVCEHGAMWTVPLQPGSDAGA